jgi:hypothetical protein
MVFLDDGKKIKLTSRQKKVKADASAGRGTIALCSAAARTAEIHGRRAS